MKSLSIILAFVLWAIIKASAQTPAQTVPSFSFRKLDKKEFTSKNLEASKLLFLFFLIRNVTTVSDLSNISASITASLIKQPFI